MKYYAYLDKHGQWVGPSSRIPKLFRGLMGFDQLTDEQRAAKRFYPCTLINADYNPSTHTRSGLTWTFDEATQTVTATYTLTPLPLSTLIQRKLTQVDQHRDYLLAQGVPYQFPDGPGTIQTRDATDHRNILANANAAQLYLISGHPDAPMQFRDQENTVHNLTAQQLVEMCAYVMAYGQEIYSTSWQIKDEIKLLTDPLEIVNHPAWAVDEQPAVPTEPEGM